jgi:hypothetical protein
MALCLVMERGDSANFNKTKNHAVPAQGHGAKYLDPA